MPLTTADSGRGRLALFDLDNTLADRVGAFRRWIATFQSHYRVADDSTAWLFAADGDGLVPRPEFLQAAKDRFQLDASVEELVAWYAETYPACYAYESESFAALELLRDGGWRVGVVTNGRTAQQHEKMRRTGLSDVVDVVCVSEELGIRKPNAGIFQVAAQRCGATLEGWMVGDSVEADIAGGAGVGLRTMWLARGRTWDPALAPPDAVVSTVSEAVARLLAHSQ